MQPPFLQNSFYAKVGEDFLLLLFVVVLSAV